MKKTDPEVAARAVLDACAGCDACRFLMDTSCLFFPELFRLSDREFDGGDETSSLELRRLIDLCNFCGQCPCPDIRAGVIEAKNLFIERDGLKFGVRTIEDVERIAKLCGTFPRLINGLFNNRAAGGLLKAAMGIHGARKMPRFPEETFPEWAARNRLTEKDAGSGRSVAYFAGCTGKYLFPEVPKAAVDVLQRNGVRVYVPDQKCCGMPPFLEGDRKVTLDFARFNADRLAEAVDEGYDIVCSCPTCGYMLRNILAEGAYFSDAYQESAGGDEKVLQIPVKQRIGDKKDRRFEYFSKTMYRDILKDEGYFSSIPALKRIQAAENSYDLGEYLLYLHGNGDLTADFGPVAGRMVYYPPCHLREQEIGRPWEKLLEMIPGLDLAVVDGSFYCCGLAGVMGFKREFHDASVSLAGPLMEKLKSLDAETIVTDCLSCRIQFQQLLPHRVLHPVEILQKSIAETGPAEPSASGTGRK